MQFSEAGHYFMAICACGRDADRLDASLPVCRPAQKRDAQGKARRRVRVHASGRRRHRRAAGTLDSRSQRGRGRRAGRQAAPCVRNTFLLALDRHLPEAGAAGRVALDGARSSPRTFAAKATRTSCDWPERPWKLPERCSSTRFALTIGLRGSTRRLSHSCCLCALHEGALIMAERLRRKISIAGAAGHAPPARLTLSIGTTDFVPGDDSALIMHRVEEALHAAIEAGGNCIRSRLGDRLETPAKGDLVAAC